MLLSEPPPSPGDLNFKLFGIPVRVHPMFWLVSVLFGLGATGGKPALMIIWVLLVFVSILVHEMGHALAARANGASPWITLYSMGGLASYQSRQTPAQHIFVLLSGPGAGFLLAAFVVALLNALGHRVDFHLGGVQGISWTLDFDPAGWPFTSIQTREGEIRVYLLIEWLLYVNIFWGLVNLLPVFPLDGGQIANEVSRIQGSRDPLIALKISMFTAVLVAAYAYLKLDQGYMAFFFAYLAYTNYATMQQYLGRGGFGSGW